VFEGTFIPGRIALTSLSTTSLTGFQQITLWMFHYTALR